jgi:MFS family permease
MTATKPQLAPAQAQAKATAPAFPLIGTVLADLILLSAEYLLTFAGLLLFSGRLADRHGGRRMLTAGLLSLFGLVPGVLLLPAGATRRRVRPPAHPRQ